MSAAPLLIALASLGTWNLVSALARLYCRAPAAPRYWGWIAVGAWAGVILMSGGAP